MKYQYLKYKFQKSKIKSKDDFLSQICKWDIIYSSSLYKPEVVPRYKVEGTILTTPIQVP